MSMNLAGPYLTTTSTKKRATKVTKAQQEELERGWRDRNQRLKEIRLPKETFEQYTEWVYGKGKKDKGEKKSGKKITKTYAALVVSKKEADGNECTNTERQGSNSNISSVSADIPGHGHIWVTGACSSKPSPTYTGTKIIGIAQMAKSNAVPVFSEESIIDIARMRR